MKNVAQAALGRLKDMDVRALAGSACLWAWVDAIYMSSFFAPFGQRGFMPEVAAWTTFLLVVPLSLLYLAQAACVREAILRAPLVLASGAAGTVGSALFMLSAAFHIWPLLVLGAVLCAFFMGTSILGWGAVYCKDGTHSVALYVAGGFACALIPDITFMMMAPVASGVAPCALPVLSNALLLLVPREKRAYMLLAPRTGASRQVEGAPRASNHESSPRHKFAGKIRLTFGISVPTVISLALIMLGLGYMQHTVSFTQIPGSVEHASSIMQGVRGIVSLAVFALAVLAPRRAHWAYRAGLLAIIAGFSLMPLLAASQYFWVAGAVVLAGYTTFDVLIWVIVAQAAYAALSDPLRIVAVMRMLVSSLFCGLGGLAGMCSTLASFEAPFPYAEAIFVGYLMTVAVVLVLSGRDVWDLFDARPAAQAASGATSPEEALDALSERWGLTLREREVFSFLAVGRTQPWVAERLGISESTVNSHVRHIYAKAGVNSRQEMLDLVFCAQSCEAVDEKDALTDSC